MSGKRYPEEFGIEAIRQVMYLGHSIAQLTDRLGVATHSLYAWVRKYSTYTAEHQARTDKQVDIRRPQKELKHVTEERDS